VAVSLSQEPEARQESPAAAAAHANLTFSTSHDCMACHNGLTTPSGENVSIGTAWRASMMANSARDPYWMAGVRRETIDHPTATHEIEHECSICHMPMANALARAAGGTGEIFRFLPIGSDDSEEHRLAADGVSCTLCHQIGPERFGTPESFVGGFVLNAPPAGTEPAMFGPFAVDAGRMSVMRSATGHVPTEAPHIRESELCATCHTLITQALGPGGQVVGSLPEQVMYLEWRHSAFRSERSCQSCHMPAVAEPTPIASVLGEPREGLGRHTFIGGNFFILGMLNRYRYDLGVEALPQEFEATIHATLTQLQRDTAALAIAGAGVAGGRLSFDVQTRNLTGHKLPTGYPSRRAWLHVTVRDRNGITIFESGAVDARGLIRGNDNDATPLGVEPHVDEITTPDQVQIYETIMADPAGMVTTGLLQASQYVKDNRLLPRGFDKATAPPEVAVHGAARQDANFDDTGDRTRYAIAVNAANGPFAIEAELRFQVVGYRWAENLRRYDAFETRRFVQYYDSMATGSSVALARATATTP
jgi:hypothetical protein